MKAGHLVRSSTGLPNNERLQWRRVPCCCSVPDRRSSAADLIEWPQNLRPKSGRLSKSALSRLKVQDLKAELARRDCQASGDKTELVSRLLEVVGREWAAQSPPEVVATIGRTTDSQTAEGTDARHVERLAGPREADEFSDQENSHVETDHERGRDAIDNKLGIHDMDALSKPCSVAPKQKDFQNNPKTLAGRQVSGASGKVSQNGRESGKVGSRGMVQDISGNGGGPKRTFISHETQSDCETNVLRQHSQGQPSSDTDMFTNGSAKAIGGTAGTEGMASKKLLEHMNQNPTGMQLVFLGTSSSRPTQNRSMPAVAFRNTKDVWLFDAGEDTQRQIVKQQSIRPSKVSRLFVTGISPEQTMGIPGLLCIIGAAREHGHEGADIPLQIYGPVGLSGFIQTFLEVSQTYMEMPVVVYELTTKSVPDKKRVQRLSHRSKIWRVSIPPDKLNRNGWHDADLMGFLPLMRNRVKRTGKTWSQPNSRDERAYFRPHDLPPSGDPLRAPLHWTEITWTLRISDGYKIVAAPLNHLSPSLAFVICEANKVGALDVSKAAELGIVEGRDYGKLKSGEPVTSKNGDIITPDRVLSADRQGRCVVIMGDTKDASSIGRLVDQPDVVALPVTHFHSQGMERSINGLTADTAGRFAESVDARCLVFRHVNPEAEEDCRGVEALVQDAKSEFSGKVTVAYDMYIHMLHEKQ